MLKVLEYDKKLLTETEQTIIERIILDPKFFTCKTITELARAYYVSESTITRTAKHLGFDNIKALQMHVYERLNFLSKNFEINETMNLSDIVNNIRVYYSYSIHQTIDNLNLTILDKLINDVFLKKRIYTFGIGNNFLACSILNNNLNMIGYNCFATENVYTLMLMMVNFTTDDLLIIFSKSGVAKEIVTIISLANKLKIDVALITNSQKFSENFKVKHLLTFQLHQNDNEIFPSLSSKIVEILISDIIFKALVKIKPNLQLKIDIANNLTDD